MTAEYRKRQIVRDNLGNTYAIDKVNEDGTLDLHCVATKECFNAPAAEVILIEGLVEA